MVRLPPPLRPLFPYLKPAYTALTRAVAPASVALSSRRGPDGLPTGVVASTEQAAESSGGRWLPATPPDTVQRIAPPPGPADAVFAAELAEDVPRTVVAELPRGRVLGLQRAVITGRDDLVQDLSYYFGTTRPREHPIFLHPFPAPPLHIDGRLGVLATRGDVNYYHFLMDVLPRLAVLAASPGIEPPERWYVPTTTRFQRELLDLAGIDEAARVDADTHPHVRADTLVVPSPPSMTVVNPPWVVRHLRQVLLTGDARRVPGKGVYVTRGSGANNRSVANEADVIDALLPRGFEAVDPGRMSVAEQIRAFATADVIVSAHGAALANLVFAGEGATVVELFPAGAVVPDYWKLAGGVPGLSYRYQTGVGPASPRGRSQMLVSDIEVDVPRLTAVVDGLLGVG